ncbi:cytochrome P450 [Nonomuraea sp. NPDC003804]|uniref:cytochrome P450 n=1 Tax=Nonomuraea sp. NPDC003804 TaxID=3154547 RepID=UPI0033A0D672
MPLQMTVICEILGIPPAHRQDFGRWCDDVVSSRPDDSSASHDGQARAEALRNLMGYIGGIIEEKRWHPGDDLISTLVNPGEPDGEQAELTDHEITSLIFLLLVAGCETTINLIGNGMLALLRHPDQLPLLRRPSESLLEQAIEELLRYDSPVEISTWRFTRQPLR